MATPVRSSDPRDPRLDPMSPIPPADSDPLNPSALRSIRASTIAPSVQSRTSNGILIAAVIAVLAVIAYFMFAGGAPTPTDEAAPPATTEPAPAGTAPTEPPQRLRQLLLRLTRPLRPNLRQRLPNRHLRDSTG